VGDALARVFEQGTVKRSDVLVQSKLWNTFHKPAYVLPALRACLQRLRLSHLDLFVMHWPVAFTLVAEDVFYPKTPAGAFMLEPVPLEDTWRAMEVRASAAAVGVR
jgi:diketogulonate reductase-like aldo/keto reductase